MKPTLNSLKYILSFICFICTNTSHTAINATAIQQQADPTIKELYHTLNTKPNTSMVNRLDMISEYFKGKPYLLGSLGEGPHGRYDQFPAYRTDAFDCDTYVNTVIALALANSLARFQQCLKLIRYKEGKVSYITRNHFTSIDWNKNNQMQGILKDITEEIHDQNNHSVAKIAHALIDKPNWYAHKTKDVIRLDHEDSLGQQHLLSNLQLKGKKLHRIPSTIPYLPFTALFSNKKPNLYLFSQIPDGAIVEIIRPNWDLRQIIGTSLNVSHLGFAIWHKDMVYFRQASSQYGKVVDVPLIDYLNSARTSKTIKGINVQIVVPDARCKTVD